MKNLRIFRFALLLVSSLGMQTPGGWARANSAPNIVLILADDPGYGDIRAYNSESKIATPHLDALAAFIESQKPGSPFFFFFSLTAPHTPWMPTREFQGKSGAGMYGDFVMHTDSVVGDVQALKKRWKSLSIDAPLGGI